MQRKVHLSQLPYINVVDKEYSPDGKFTGQLLEGKRVKGKFEYANGDVYEGGWLNKQKHYFGKYTWATGEKKCYEGDF